MATSSASTFLTAHGAAVRVLAVYDMIGEELCCSIYLQSASTGMAPRDNGEYLFPPVFIERNGVHSMHASVAVPPPAVTDKMAAARFVRREHDPYPILELNMAGKWRIAHTVQRPLDRTPYVKLGAQHEPGNDAAASCLPVEKV
jgi:hypothetical protein